MYSWIKPHTIPLPRGQRANESPTHAVPGRVSAPNRQPPEIDDSSENRPEVHLPAMRLSQAENLWIMDPVLRQPPQQFPPSLPQFGHLPPELRQQIWQMCVCPRTNDWIRVFEACFEVPSEGGAYVLDVDFDRAPSSPDYYQLLRKRHRAISTVSLVSKEANKVVGDMFVRLYTTSPGPWQIPTPWGRSKYLLVCPDHDRWTVNLYHPDPDPAAKDSVVPFERWITCPWNLGLAEERFFNRCKRRLLSSMRHVLLEVDHLMGDTPHDMSVFLRSLTKLSTMMIHSTSACTTTRCFWKHSVSVTIPENVDATDFLLRRLKQHYGISHSLLKSGSTGEPRDVEDHFLTALESQEKHLSKRMRCESCRSRYWLELLDRLQELNERKVQWVDLA